VIGLVFALPLALRLGGEVPERQEPEGGSLGL
jgi:hypothetical protein